MAADRPYGPGETSARSLAYLRSRLTDELAAAAKATLAVSTSRHVQLATLYAREIRSHGPCGAGGATWVEGAPGPGDGELT